MAFSFEFLVPSYDEGTIEAFRALFGEDFPEEGYEWHCGRPGTIHETLAKAVGRELTPTETHLAKILWDMRRRSRENDSLVSALSAFTDLFGFSLLEDDPTSSPRCELEEAIDDSESLREEPSIKRYLEKLEEDDDEEEDDEEEDLELDAAWDDYYAHREDDGEEE